MRHPRLRALISSRLVLLVLLTIALVSLGSNLLVNRQFDHYMEEQQRAKAADVAEHLSAQYDAVTGGWSLDYVHGMGMLALYDGYLIKLSDAEGTLLWDAQDHDMALCHDMMATITARMQEERPSLDGGFESHRYELRQGDTLVGYLDVSYYAPYALSEQDFRFITALNRVLVVTGALALLVALVVGVLLARGIARPVARIAQATEQIAEGRYGTRLAGDVRARELAELTTAVNQMAAALEEQDELRRRLTSDVAHELRTPVANLSSYLELMAAGVMEPTHERLQRCHAELQRLAALIADLERLQRAEGGDLVLEREEVNLLSLAREVVVGFDVQLEERGLSVRVEGVPVVVYADANRIRQVLANLVSNAIKYSDAQGVVRLLVEDAGSMGVVHVADQGMGVPPEEREHIFERLYRTDASRARSTGGAGLGLAIVRALVEAHGGTVGVEGNEHGGSTFTVMLPKEAPGTEA